MLTKDSFCRLKKLWPCVGNDNARLAISGATMESRSDNGMAAMLICISGPYGFSCELVQQAITLKTKIGSKYSGPLNPKKDNCSCKVDFVKLLVMEGVTHIYWQIKYSSIFELVRVFTGEIITYIYW